MTRNRESMHPAFQAYTHQLNKVLPTVLGWLVLFALLWNVAPVTAQSAPLALSDYPRPQSDNGWGVHWSPTLLAQIPRCGGPLFGRGGRAGITLGQADAA